MKRSQDSVDRIVCQWTDVRPDLDVSPIEIIGRVSRLSRIIDKRLAANFAEHGLDQNWMYDVLATLRRTGEPYELTAGDLVRQTMVTTGAITNRIDRLTEHGLVERVQHAKDRRVVVVRLTPAGVRLVDEVSQSHYPFENDLLSSLSSTQQANQAKALRTLLVDLGDTAEDLL